MRIAVDVMGGDHGCGVVIEGVKLALRAHFRIAEIHLVGDQREIKSEMERSRLNDPRVHIVHASEVLTMEDKPLVAVRRKKDSSLVRAVDLVKTGKADAIISTGNTGALVTAATLALRRLDGIERPAIATIVPSQKSEFVLIDAGANQDCKPVHLAQFAIMGNIYSREILGHRKPRVGILSNGSEEFKGTELTQEAAKICRELDLHFIGYVEGTDMFSDRVEVVVTDGFVGNLVLKTCEGLGKCIARMLKHELSANPVRQFGAALAAGGFITFKKRMNPDAYGGAPILGLNNTVIKAHGAAREEAIMNAIRVATETIRTHLNQLIRDDVCRANERLTAAPNNAVAHALA